MHFRQFLCSAGILLGSAAGAVPALASVAPQSTPAVGTHAATPYTLTGKIAKVSLPKNQVTVRAAGKLRVLTTSSSTAVTIKSNRSTLKKLKVGETVHVTGVQLGRLSLALTIAG
jgi:hypothetical protein